MAVHFEPIVGDLELSLTFYTFVSISVSFNLSVLKCLEVAIFFKNSSKYHEFND